LLLALAGSAVVALGWQKERLARARHEELMMQLKIVLTRVSPASSRGEAPTASPVFAPARIDNATLDALAERVAARVRQPATVPTGPEPRERTAPPEPSPEALAASESARQQLGRLMVRGAFDEQDALTLRRTLESAPSEDARKLRLEIARAINLGKLQPPQGPFFTPP
jgi:hypothetical protein